MREHFGITANGHESYSNMGSQYRLKITRAADVAIVKALLEAYGWKPRKTPQRTYPSGPIDDHGFVRAWVELHSSIDVARIGRKKAPSPRLRIYGNQFLLEEMSRIISAGVGMLLRAPQKTVNKTTKGLYYCNSSFGAVFQCNRVQAGKAGW